MSLSRVAWGQNVTISVNSMLQAHIMTPCNPCLRLIYVDTFGGGFPTVQGLIVSGNTFGNLVAGSFDGFFFNQITGFSFIDNIISMKSTDVNTYATKFY